MKYKTFKDLILQYNIDLFYLCNSNQIDTKIIETYEENSIIDESLEKALSDAISNVTNFSQLYSFYDVCRNSGLKIADDFVVIELDNTKQRYDIDLNELYLNKILFV